jgi:hypothetical protein
MTRLRAVPAVFVFALLGIGIDARAQTAEVTAFGGIGFGGSLTSPSSGESIGIDAGPIYGGAFSTPLSSTWRFEGLFLRQQSQVAGEWPGTDVAVSLERYLAGFQEEVPWGKARAFGTFLIGATRFAPAGSDDEWWFTLGLGLGVKTRLSGHVGLRFEARGYYVPVSGRGVTVCGSGGCAFAYSVSGMFQGDVTAGIFFGF